MSTRSFVACALLVGLFGEGRARGDAGTVSDALLDLGRPLGLIGDDIALEPLGLLQADARIRASETEGHDSLAIARARLGGRARVGKRFLGSVVFEAARDKPGLLDASLTWMPLDDVEITIGYTRSTLSATNRAPVATLSLVERSTLSRALWPTRDVGVEAHLLPIALPLELFARIGTGSVSPLGNDLEDGLAFEGRVDVVIGRARAQAPWRRIARDRFGDDAWGARLGLGLRVEEAGFQQGASGETMTGFVFHRAPVVVGPRAVSEAHLTFFAGPLFLVVEAGVAREARAVDTDGNPETPRAALPAISTAGMVVEATWTVVGERRGEGVWPTARADAVLPFALDVAARGERVSLGHGATDTAPGGAWSGTLATTLTVNRFVALSVVGQALVYDAPPLEDPTRDHSWVALARVTLSVR